MPCFLPRVEMEAQCFKLAHSVRPTFVMLSSARGAREKACVANEKIFKDMAFDFCCIDLDV